MCIKYVIYSSAYMNVLVFCLNACLSRMRRTGFALFLYFLYICHLNCVHNDNFLYGNIFKNNTQPRKVQFFRTSIVFFRIRFCQAQNIKGQILNCAWPAPRKIRKCKNFLATRGKIFYQIIFSTLKKTKCKQEKYLIRK